MWNKAVLRVQVHEFYGKITTSWNLWNFHTFALLFPGKCILSCCFAMQMKGCFSIKISVFCQQLFLLKQYLRSVQKIIQRNSLRGDCCVIHKTSQLLPQTVKKSKYKKKKKGVGGYIFKNVWNEQKTILSGKIPYKISRLNKSSFTSLTSQSNCPRSQA